MPSADITGEKINQFQRERVLRVTRFSRIFKKVSLAFDNNFHKISQNFPQHYSQNFLIISCNFVFHFYLSYFENGGVSRIKALENPSTDIRHFLSWFVNVNKWESRFLRLNTAKNTDFIKKCLKYKLLRTKFPTKTQWTHMSIPPPQELNLGVPKSDMFEVF